MAAKCVCIVCVNIIFSNVSIMCLLMSVCVLCPYFDMMMILIILLFCVCVCVCTLSS